MINDTRPSIYNVSVVVTRVESTSSAYIELNPDHIVRELHTSGIWRISMDAIKPQYCKIAITNFWVTYKCSWHAQDQI